MKKPAKLHAKKAAVAPVKAPASHVGQFEPLMPADHVAAPLHASAAQLLQEAAALAAVGRAVQPALTDLLRQMNSYYTNRIEGQHTTPVEIERAMRGQFDAGADLARRQRLALAHIDCERYAEESLVPAGGIDGWRPAFEEALPQRLHSELYSRLPPADRGTDDGGLVVPGALRTRDVSVGQHVAPPHGDVPMFLRHWAEVYAGQPSGQHAVIATAAAHHRLAWVHPFIDGNGRVARLQTHLALHGMGLTGGLWSPLRGFARTHADYYAHLAAADAPRDSATDGRGSLSQRALVQWVEYVLGVCLDQVRFMTGQLQFDALRGRAESYVRRLAEQRGSGVTIRSVEALHAVLAGPAPRAQLLAAMGGALRTAVRELSALIRAGLLAPTEPPSGSDRREQWFRFAVPMEALAVLFPRLWPEAEGGG